MTNGNIYVRVPDEEGHVILAESVKSDVSVMRSSRTLRYAEGMTFTGQLQLQRRESSFTRKLFMALKFYADIQNRCAKLGISCNLETDAQSSTR
jgi:hypothetical protein